MDQQQNPRKQRSPRDLERMRAFIEGMAPERRARIMQFLAERESKAPAVGEQAPDFELPMLDRKAQVRLSSLRGIKPVALIFGSFT